MMTKTSKFCYSRNWEDIPEESRTFILSGGGESMRQSPPRKCGD